MELGRNPRVEDLFDSFVDPRNDLKSRFGVVVDNNCSFDMNSTDEEVVSFSKELQERSKALSGKPKRRNAAVHDAAVLRWVHHLRKQSGTRVWLVTFNWSLPGAVPQDTDAATLAVTVGALLQWLSPLASSQGHSEDFAAGFAKMVRDRVLPPDRFFQLNDFLLLQDLQGSTKDLPAEDVEAALLYIEQEGAALDLSRAHDRERLSHSLAKFMVDRGRKYNRELARLEAETSQLQDEKAEAHMKLADAEARYIAQIDDLQSSKSKLEQQSHRDHLVSEAILRLVLIGLVLGAFSVGFLVLADQLGEGENLFQKTSNSWEFMTSLNGLLALFLSWIFVGKDRFRALGGPLGRMFKVYN